VGPTCAPRETNLETETLIFEISNAENNNRNFFQKGTSLMQKPVSEIGRANEPLSRDD
jgi:hypothetical protein